MKVMSEINLNNNNNDSEIESNIVRVVELGLAKLNTVSHHEHLRCAKLVSPLVRQLSKESNYTLDVNRRSLIIGVEENEPEDDVYEDQMEIELESTLETALDTKVNEESDNSSEGFETELIETLGKTIEVFDSTRHVNGHNTTNSNIKEEATLANSHNICNEIDKETSAHITDNSNETEVHNRTISSLNVNLDSAIIDINKVSTETDTQQDISSNSLTVLRSTEKVNDISSEVTSSLHDDDDDAEITENFGNTADINRNKDCDYLDTLETSGIIKTIDSEINSDIDDSEGTEQVTYRSVLALSSIYTHFNTLKKKASGKHCGKR